MAIVVVGFFPYVCPEPVLVKRAFFKHKWLKKIRFLRRWGCCSSLSARNGANKRQQQAEATGCMPMAAAVSENASF
jgi:hypothetical protein